MKRATNILRTALLLVVATFAAQEAANKELPRKAHRFLTYVTTVETSGVQASFLEHLMLGFYYANDTCAPRPLRIS